MKIISGLAVLLVLSGCAELNSAMSSVNSALGTVNSTIGGVTGAASSEKVYNVGSRSDREYAISGLKIGVYGIDPKSLGTMSSRSGVHFLGTLKNKTSRRIGVSFNVPVYDANGRYLESVVATVYAPAGETVAINKDLPNQLHWRSGYSLNTRKMKIDVQKF